jgi:hypothetical protein
MGDLDLLGGAERKRPRVRGFADWSPRGDTIALLDQVRGVLAEYAEHLPLTLRQIFYRLVAAHNYEKTERAYGRLGEHLVRARRAHLIKMDVIRDDDADCWGGGGWDSVEYYLEHLREEAERFRLDRTAGQPTRLVVMCEAAGMAPQLAEVCAPYGIAVYPSSGFSSLTAVYDFASTCRWQDRPTEVLHVGDHDPSGVHLYLAMAEDVMAFAGGPERVRFTRLAVTPDQIEHNGLPTAPAKSTDGRAWAGDTVQCEALPPDVLMQIVRDAIEARLDRGTYERVLRQEQAARRELITRFGDGE